MISPSIKFTNADVDFSVSANGERGKKVASGFSYSSDNNPLWASEKEILQIIEKSGNGEL